MTPENNPGANKAADPGVREAVRVTKPWGYELIFAHTDRYVGKVLHIEKGHQLSRQYHKVKDETIFVSTGRLVLEVGPAGSVVTRTLGPGEGFRVRPGTIHRFVAAETCDLLEVSTPELDDVVRLEDDYGREGTSEP
jgi:mannose-6-phosphate isomerase-like protein (cupin superfamily)